MGVPVAGRIRGFVGIPRVTFLWQRGKIELIFY